MNDENAIVQNLKDAGCEQEFITEFMENFRREKFSDDMKLLQSHRSLLLDRLHKEQRHIDYLDYLVYKMTKENLI